MKKNIKEWIDDNSWIKNSETYKTGLYKKYKPETIPMINLKNLKLQKLITFLNFWNLNEPYPNEIYLYIDTLSEEDSSEIENTHLRELIDSGINFFSIKTNNLQLLIYLLENNFITNDDALRWASENGKIEIVKYLVDHGANVHVLDDEALRWASANGHLDVVEYLLDHNANIHARNNKALAWASQNGKIDVVEYLVDHGANIHANDDQALRWASANGHLDVVTFLKSKM